MKESEMETKYNFWYRFSKKPGGIFYNYKISSGMKGSNLEQIKLQFSKIYPFKRHFIFKVKKIWKIRLEPQEC